MLSSLAAFLKFNKHGNVYSFLRNYLQSKIGVISQSYKHYISYHV